MSNVYRQEPPTNSDPNLDRATAWKSNGFQIISPGQDGAYGAGGEYTTTNASSLLSGTTRSTERDNITNFHSGRLGN